MSTDTVLHVDLPEDPVLALRALADAAQGGHVTGVAVALLLPRARYLVEVIGEARRSPIRARGAVTLLDDHLRELIDSRRDTRTTL